MIYMMDLLGDIITEIRWFILYTLDDNIYIGCVNELIYHQLC